ncbi:hypothetical protein AAG906_021641 [Vitis piasezkii]
MKQRDQVAVKYNLDGIFIGESTVHLTSYLGILARTMVPIRYQTWHVVPKQLKDKLWDSIEVTHSYLHHLYAKHQSFLTILRISRSSKERRKKHIYNHHLSRKGYLSQENGRSVNGSNDILVEALGTPEYSGRVKAKGNRLVSDFIADLKKSKETFKRSASKLSQVGATPQSDVRKCELAVETKENIVAGGTIILECGPNYLVVVDASYDSSAPLPIPIPGQTTTVGAAIGYQVLWPAHLVIIHTLISTSKKGKKQKENEVEVKSKGEKAQDIKNFEALVGLMSSTSRVHPSFKTFLMKEDMDMIISSKEVSSNCILYYIRHLHRKLIDGKQFPLWVLVALEMKRMIAYYLDPMVVNHNIISFYRAIRINPPKKKTSKREPTWVKVVCPRQPGSVECGYYVMRYMKEIIANPNQLTSKVFGVFSIWIIQWLLYFDGCVIGKLRGEA